MNGNSQFEQFKRVLDALAKHKVDYILVGGVAVILHGIERLTRDIDIFVKMEHRNIERLRNALHSIFDDESINEITLEELQKYAVIRFGVNDNFCVDIMARIGEVAVYEDLEFETILHDGINVRIATPETLYNLKKDTIRHKDRFDAAYLLDLIKTREADAAPKKTK
ncbi:MAG: nucleotidyl transferase AbiEii/AbiGii toxin family protein [Candidatus Aminicenantes bacterium]|nr:MAG: nucleotidyl transferase AbiEii/AbiGii toxin family protein [Candidatus Aminicenantes bacterium]